jgi:hypothetical protein
MPLATHGDTLFLKQLLQKIRLSLIQTAMESIPAPMMLVSCAESLRYCFAFPSPQGELTSSNSIRLAVLSRRRLR